MGLKFKLIASRRIRLFNNTNHLLLNHFSLGFLNNYTGSVFISYNGSYNYCKNKKIILDLTYLIKENKVNLLLNFDLANLLFLNESLTKKVIQKKSIINKVSEPGLSYASATQSLLDQSINESEAEMESDRDNEEEVQSLSQRYLRRSATFQRY